MADPHYSLFSHPPNPNSQPQFQPIQPYPSNVSAPPVYAGLQTAYPNPDVAHTWVSEQFASVYPIPNAIPPILPNGGCYPPQTSNWSNSYLQSSASQKKPKFKKQLTKMNQSVRCEICDTYCTSIELYEKHVSGKRHLKTLKNKYAPQPTPSQPKQKLGEDAVKVCTTCNVPCNGEKAYTDHLAGKRHKAQEKENAALSEDGMEGASASAVDNDLDAKKQKLMESGVVEESIIVPSSGEAVCKSDVASVEHFSGQKHILEASPSSTGGQHNNSGTLTVPPIPRQDLGTKAQKLIECGVAKGSMRFCTACNIVCNSEVVFADHIAGKKHIMQVQKYYGDASGSGTATNLNQPISPATMKPPEDIETKRRKVMGSGTSLASVRVCSLCNVVCNSDTVFNTHLSGQKHATMLKKMTQPSM